MWILVALGVVSTVSAVSAVSAGSAGSAGNVQDCKVTAIVTYASCLNLCINKYGSNPKTQRSYFNDSSGYCMPIANCSSGMMLCYMNNSCVEAINASSKAGVNMISEGYNEKIVLLSVVINGFIDASMSIICQPAWVSSYTLVVVSAYVRQKYYCDVEREVGQIYPTPIGEYFFNLLATQQQLDAIAYSFGPDPADALTVCMWVGLLLLLICNIAQCIFQVTRKTRHPEVI